MTSSYHIRYLQRQEIDLLKWDACIEAAPNGMIYGKSFYLDSMTAGQWDALVLDDYTAVMPLTWKKKFGFRYLYQPYFTPMLGMFGDPPAPGTLSAFLQAIPKKFRYWDIDLNETNIILQSSAENAPSGDPHNSCLPDGIPVRTKTRPNHFLKLDLPQEEMTANYKRLARRMCKRAIDENLEIIKNSSPAELIDLYRRQYGNRHPKITAAVYERFAACAASALSGGLAKTYLAKEPNGGVVAFYLVFIDKRFIYSILGGSSEDGKEKGAFYLLTDAVIKEHAESGRIFRFEGSDIPGIAFFDALFGATPVTYPHLTMNNLPFPIRLFK